MRTSAKQAETPVYNLPFVFALSVVLLILTGSLHITRYPPNSYEGVKTIGSKEGLAGHFVQLSRGNVYYQVRRPPPAPSAALEPPLILIHGFSFGSKIWESTAKRLVSQGGRTVVLFDLYGRGYSDAAYPSDLPLLTSQVAELLFRLQPDLGAGPYDVAGTSMGAVIAVHFANLYPQHVRKLILVAPAGLPVHIPWTAQLAKLPVIGDVLMPILGPISLMTHARKGHANPDDPGLAPIFRDMDRMLIDQTRRNPGFFPALLSTLRNFPLGTMEAGYRQLSRHRPPGSILVVWGDKDEVTPFQHMPIVMDILGSTAVLKVLKDCGHADPLEVPHQIDDFMQALLAFLK